MYMLPKKGQNSLQVIELDNGLRHYAQVIKEYTNMDISQLPGAGAAGGMGGGLLPFLNAELQSGIEVILKNASFRGGRPTGRPDTDRRGETGSPDWYGKGAGRNFTCR